MGYVCIVNLPQGKGVGGFFFSYQARTGAGLREALSLPRNITTREKRATIPACSRRAGSERRSLPRIALHLSRAFTSLYSLHPQVPHQQYRQ